MRVNRLRLAVLASALLAALLAPAAHAAPDRTGRLLVLLDEPQRGSGASARAAAGVLAQDGVRRDGAQVPKIGLVSVRPERGVSLASLARTLRRRPGVRSVQAERRHTLRFSPNDPALYTQEPAAGAPPGTPLAWWVGRSGLAAAWDVARGDGARVAVIDTGVDAGHPDIGGKIAEAIDNDSTPGAGGAGTDEIGHGTHVSSLACGAGDNGFGIVGSGLNCRLIVVKTDLSDGSIARSIVQATDLGADAINMSFGTDGGASPARAIIEAIDYAARKDVVLVAAAADNPVEEQGDPANLLQPTGTGPDLDAGRGLSVTAADFSARRAPFAGRGSQISLAAYGSFGGDSGPAGILGAFPANRTELENGGSLLLPLPGCECRTEVQGDPRFAYLQGTSMAAPIVAGVAALAADLNPDATAADIIRALKESATRPPGTGWSPELGWGILDAGAAIARVRTIDRRAPASKLRGRTRVKRARAYTLRWSGRDPAASGLVASGVHRYEVWRSANKRPWRRIKSTSRTRWKMRVKPGSSYRFYTIAVDKAGNREAVPPRPDLRTRVDKRPRR